LAIIIDDVAFPFQVRALLALDLPITLSFFPPSPSHPDTPALARKVPCAMVHLPLEALRYSHKEPYLLRTRDSILKMERTIAAIRNHFPQVRYINNHTGSRFTADVRAMEGLLAVLDQYGFTFIDSRTTPKTVVPAIMRSQGRPYLHRDIFLDHVPEVEAIRRQIHRAIALAQRQGLAIAIGHPHKETIEALRRSKEILKKVRLIYVNELKER